MDHHIHNHSSKATDLNRAFVLGIGLNALYVIIELSAGFYYNSLALISDAGHNLSDVAALALALLAFRLTRVKATEKFTYGYRKSTILVSLINSVVLFVAIGGITWESFHRLQHPVEIAGLPMSIVAGIGIVINSISAMLFFRQKDSDLNVRGAYIHLVADAAVSLGVVVSGILISLFHIYWIDIAMSLVIVLVIFYSTWKLFKDSLSLTLDGVPNGVDLSKVTDAIKAVDGVIDLHHLHVWAISTSQNALTAHIIIHQDIKMSELRLLKKNIKHKLEHANVHHATLEFENADENCQDTHKK